MLGRAIIKERKLHKKKESMSLQGLEDRVSHYSCKMPVADEERLNFKPGKPQRREGGGGRARKREKAGKFANLGEEEPSKRIFVLGGGTPKRSLTPSDKQKGQVNKVQTPEKKGKKEGRKKEGEN